MDGLRGIHILSGGKEKALPEILAASGLLNVRENFMPEKYHIKTEPVPPRWPRIGKYGMVDWREDCARCHNCVKKACVYDRHRHETDYIRNLSDVDALFFDCMGCFSCVRTAPRTFCACPSTPSTKRWETTTGLPRSSKRPGPRRRRPKSRFPAQGIADHFRRRL